MTETHATTGGAAEGRPVTLTINGQSVIAHGGTTVVEAAWEGGVPRVTSIGCMEGVCGSCRIILKQGAKVSLGLACQTFVEEGLEVIFLPPQAAPRHHYELSDFKDGWDIHARFQEIFPEAARCRHCHGCNVSCPKDIKVEEGVAQASAGRFQAAGEIFFECVMCDLCDSACPEFIAPAHVGLFSRRVTAHFHLRPPNLINRLEELRQEKQGRPGLNREDHDE